MMKKNQNMTVWIRKIVFGLAQCGRALAGAGWSMAQQQQCTPLDLPNTEKKKSVINRI
jgi:hypothetical protein